jgi:LPS-assembly protein
LPDWLIRADKLSLDSEKGDAEVTNGALYFKDTAVVRVPSFAFPMTGQRRSGLLPPTIESNSIDGFTYSQPYYWNIAPNRDLLITPRLMTERGLNMSGEFRYLESVLPPFQGTAKLDVMPYDRLGGSSRWGTSWTGSIKRRRGIERRLSSPYCQSSAPMVLAGGPWRTAPS